MGLRLRNIFCLGLALACAPWAFGQSRSGHNDAQAKRPALEPVSCPLPAEGAKAESGAAPIATVAGEPIYEQDLEDATAAQMLKVHQEEYKIESNALDSLIRKKLVEDEAKKQGITVEQLYQKEVDSKIPEPAEAEVKGYYFAVKNQVNEPFEKIEPQLAKVVKALEVQQAREKYADSLRTAENVSILLQPPTVKLGPDDPGRVEGNPAAPVTIVEFGDFQCPFCGRVEPTLADLLKKYEGRVKLVFRDFPLSAIHAHAEAAAEASRCAESQGKFWPMHDAMYSDQAKLTERDLIETAARLGMDRGSFAACLKSGKYKAAVQQDVAAGRKAGVTGTPTFFINGSYLEGSVPSAQFEKIIDTDLTALNGKAAVASR
ncbi:MAG TPA: thioredoxin domain-containing protein [Terriglobales bacterium]|nr:thioredoxin domain-containing protein [Terriglobales bacterium]